MDSLIPSGDIDRSYAEATKVAGGAVLSSNFLKRMALPISTRGHICFMISQVRSTVSVNPYEKGDPKLTNATGGNALLHFSDWIFEFQKRHKNDQITSKNSKDGNPDGHWCKIIFKKTPNETTGAEIRYPIRYGRTGGKSVWIEYEIFDSLVKWGFVEKAGSWVTVNQKLIDELKENNFEIPEKIQGEDAFTACLEENPELTKYLFTKLKETLTLV